jgi:hypothetical protein
MRRLYLLAASVFSLGIVHCVGDDPGVTNNNSGGQDASLTDGATSDATSTNDASTSGDSGSNDAGSDAGPIDSCIGFNDCPSEIDENTKLQIWLRGGFGETCTGGRLVTWADQSGKGNNATPPTSSDGGAGLPAQCGVAKINDHDVVTFTAPPPRDAGSATEFIDETLDTKLGFLVSSDYTFFVVHQRTLDTTQALIATDDTFLLSSGCPGSNYEKAFFLGFNQFSGTGFGAGYYQGCARAIAPVDSFVLGHVDVSEIVFAAASGHVLYVNGAQVYKVDSGGLDLSAVSVVGRGSIGRGTDTFDDDRFHGQIAEIIGFNVALSDADRIDVEGYLKRQYGLTF